MTRGKRWMVSLRPETSDKVVFVSTARKPRHRRTPRVLLPGRQSWPLAGTTTLATRHPTRKEPKRGLTTRQGMVTYAALLPRCVRRRIAGGAEAVRFHVGRGQRGGDGEDRRRRRAQWAEPRHDRLAECEEDARASPREKSVVAPPLLWNRPETRRNGRRGP